MSRLSSFIVNSTRKWYINLRSMTIDTPNNPLWYHIQKCLVDKGLAGNNDSIITVQRDYNYTSNKYRDVSYILQDIYAEYADGATDEFAIENDELVLRKVNVTDHPPTTFSDLSKDDQNTFVKLLYNYKFDDVVRVNVSYEPEPKAKKSNKKSFINKLDGKKNKKYISESDSGNSLDTPKKKGKKDKSSDEESSEEEKPKKKSKKDESSDEESSEEEKPKKKGKKDESSDEESEEEDEPKKKDESSDEESEEEDEPKKKGKKDESSDEESEEEEDEPKKKGKKDESSDEESEEEEEEKPKKKGKKEDSDDLFSASEPSESEEEPPKKSSKKPVPKKGAQLKKVVSDSDIPSEPSSEDEPLPKRVVKKPIKAQPIKRGRGRPKKNPLPEILIETKKKKK